MCVAGDFCGRTPQLPAEAISVSPSAVGALRGTGSQMGNAPFTIDFWLGHSLRSPVLHSRLPGAGR